MGLAVQAQVIDPLTSSLSGYTTTLVLDNSHGVSSASFTDSGSGLQANFVGTVSQPEQAFLLAPVSSFSTTFIVGDRLTVNAAVPVSATAMDFGLAVAATVTPTAASAGNSWDSRRTFDWACVSVRPSQTSIRGGEDISGAAQNTSFSTAAAANTVSQLYIDWVSTDVFTLGYVDTSSVSHSLFTATFAGTSTIGTAIGFYTDMRATGTTLGNFTDLTISTIPVPEPTAMALCGLGGFLGLATWMRRKT
jgi:hypothetical protein